jgi:Outer membrane efflux protein
MTHSVFKRVRQARTLAVSGGALALAACSFGPNGNPPAVPQPAHYGAEPQVSETVPAQGIAQQFVVGAKPVPTWWRLYQSDDLNALVDEGLRNSPTLAATDKSLTAAREQLRAQVGSSMLPTIDGVAQPARQRALGIPEEGPNTFLYNTFVGQLQAHYTIDLFGASRLANAALASRVNVQVFQLESARRALAANIVTAAITSAALHAQIDTTERLITLANDDARDTARRYTLGAVSHADMLNAQQSAASLAASLDARPTPRRPISIWHSCVCLSRCRWSCRRSYCARARTSRQRMLRSRQPQRMWVWPPHRCIRACRSLHRWDKAALAGHWRFPARAPSGP